QRYEPVDSNLVLSYREAKDGQVLEEGITEAGSSASFQAAGTSYATHGEPTIPFYIFYSMFGFQRVGDQLWAFGDARGRGFLLGATAGRTTLNGEGLQHEDGHSLLVATTLPNVRAYDPAFAYELAVIVRDGLRRMLAGGEDVCYYLALYNENHVMPARPDDVSDDDIVAGLYRFASAPKVAARAPRATLLGSGAIMQQVLRAQSLLAERFGVAAEVWSVPSYQRVRAEALATERWNRLHPAEKARRPQVSRAFADAAKAGPIVAASDWLKAVPDQISRWVPGESWVSLGTDGYGRSDTRPALRRLFGIDAEHIVVAVLAELARTGRREPAEVAAAIAELGLDPEAADPLDL
ncbi:MAG TPA: pyruvate dehydrogenase (acetyl-transferring), homodimeric type, partial [Candidatus Limnocylindrales bacterium]